MISLRRNTKALLRLDWGEAVSDNAQVRNWLTRWFLSGLLLVSLTQADEPARKIVVIAHRANHEAAHENTLEAIRNAIAIKADFVELDVRRTKDGKHILTHDRSVKRMTGTNANVSDLTFEQIKALTISDAKRPGIAASRIPTFEEALDAIGSSIGLYLDFKDGDPEFLAAELRKRHQIQRTVVYLSTSEIAAWRKAEPSMRFIVSVPAKEVTVESVNALLTKYPGLILDGPITDYTPEFVKAAHARGSQVWPDIQNPDESPPQWSKALALGVDGLQTDHPSLLISYLASLGRH